MLRQLSLPLRYLGGDSEVLAQRACPGFDTLLALAVFPSLGIIATKPPDVNYIGSFHVRDLLQ